MSELIVIGKSDFALGFTLTGLKRIYETDTVRDIEGLFRKMLNDSTVGIIVTDEDTLSCLGRVLRQRLETSVQPILIVLSQSMASQDDLRDMVKNVIGIDLLVK